MMLGVVTEGKLEGLEKMMFKLTHHYESDE